MNKSNMAIEACKKNEEIWTQAYCNNIKLDGYEVSNFGNIRSYWLTVREKNKCNGFKNIISEQYKILKKVIKYGYEYFTAKKTNKNRRGKHYSIHRLVIDSWNPILTSEPPHDYPVEKWAKLDDFAKNYIGSILTVDHKNNNKSDNNFCNLERVRSRENSIRAVKAYGGATQNAKKIKRKNFVVICPHGTRHTGNDPLFFCKENNLNKKRFSKLINGKIKNYKGYTRDENYYINNKCQLNSL